MPELVFEDVRGTKRTLADLRNKVVLLTIWATWCVPCREEMPALRMIAGYTKYRRSPCGPDAKF
jgi:thiol-disulfide isomerase/thioredoxin